MSREVHIARMEPEHWGAWDASRLADHRLVGLLGGRGVGRHLLEALIDGAERAGLWTIETGIFPENEASLALHHRCGFREVGRWERLGRMNGVWARRAPRRATKPRRGLIDRS